MKPPVVYGIALALGAAFLNLALYFLGLHSDAARLTQSQWISSIGMLVIAIACTVLGIKGQRAETPPEKDFGYGRALGAGVIVSLVAGLIGVATNWFYLEIINPGFRDLIVQAQLDKMAAQGMSGDQLEKVEKGVRFFMQPVVVGLVNLFTTLFWGTVISLIAAAALKRKSTAAPIVEPPPFA